MNRFFRFKRFLIGGAWLLIGVLALYMVYDLWVSGMGDVQFGIPVAGIVFNFVLRMIPFVLLLFALGLIVEVLAEESQQGEMQPRVRQWLFWTPRVSVMIFAGFISLFSLDVFGEGYSFWEIVAAFLIHNIPTALIILAMYLAWRWEWVGGLLFTVWAVFYLLSAKGFGVGVYLSMAGLPFTLGVLFLLNWQFRQELRLSH